MNKTKQKNKKQKKPKQNIFASEIGKLARC